MQRKNIYIIFPLIIAISLFTFLLSSAKAQNTNYLQNTNDAPSGAESVYTTKLAIETSGFFNEEQREVIDFSPDHVIVKFRDQTNSPHNGFGNFNPRSQSLDAILLAQGVERIESVFPNTMGHSLFSTNKVDLDPVQRLYLKPDSNVLDIVAALSAHPDVIYAEPDYLAHAAFTPNDPHYPDQWGLTKIQAESAWDTTQGSAAVTIAIIDTGLDLNHPDLVNKLWVNPGEIAGNGIDDDGNGKVDDVNGWDWVSNDNTPQDDIGHGTHVAGVVAATTNNNIGIAGVCPNCRVMPLKVLDAGGSGTYSSIANSIIYAADKGAKVINLSLGSYADSQLLRDAVAYASQYAVVVAAAGNDNKQNPFYPAAYDDYVVAVAATDNNDQKAAFANYGEWIDISAPGVSIWSAVYDDNYAAWSGSSMAAPFVSGVAGLVRSQNMSWSAGAVRGQLLHTLDEIDNLNPGYEGQLGAGRLNAANAVTTTDQPELSIVNYTIDGVINGNPEPGSTVTMTVSLQNMWADATNVTAVLSTTDALVTLIDDTVNFGDISGYAKVTNTIDTFSFSVDGGAPYNHLIPFKFTLSGNEGDYTSTIPYTVTVANGIVHLSGIISSDTILTSDYIYMIDSDMRVNTGVTLTIQPGTVLQFNGPYVLDVQGSLIAIGTPDQMIRFTSAEQYPEPGDWRSIVFHNSPNATYNTEGHYTGGSALAYAEVEYGGTVLIYKSRPYFAYNHIHDNIATGGGIPEYPWDTGVITYYPYNNDGFAIRDSIIENNMGGGIKVESGLITITHNIIRNNISGSWAGGITCLGGECRILENRIINNQGTSFTGAIFSYSANVTVKNNLIANNIGPQTLSDRGGSVFSKWNGTFDIISNTITNNSAFAAFLLQRTYSNDFLQNNNIIGNAGQYAVYLHSNAYQSFDASGNQWGTLETSEIDGWIFDFHDDFNIGEVQYTPIATQPISGTPPFLWNATTNPESPINQGVMTIQLDFSAPMTTTTQPTVTFGISPTYNTHIISGDWLSTTRWVGNYTVNYYTGDGLQKLRVAGARAMNDGMEIPEDTRFTFEIATIGATNINATPTYGQVALSWNASDLETTAGYNLYRATTSGGPYTRLNQTVMSTTSYTDTNVVNGIAYYYIVRLLTTDLYEMDYGTEIAATPNDFTAPSMPAVIDDGTCTPNTNYLHATWSASDPESGINAYQYSIGTWAGGTDVINWTSVGVNTEVTRTGLSLIETVTYYVNVKAQNGVGTWGSVGSSNGIEINGGCPAVAFTASPRSGAYPLTVQFSDQSIGSVLAHLWDFGDGSISSVANPTHIYNSTGAFTVTLTVTGSVTSNTRTEPTYIVISEPPPVAAFTASSTLGLKPLSIDFTDQSTGEIGSWLWNFGDGITSTLPNPSHTYHVANVYTVSLTVNGPGGSDNEMKTNYVTVYEPTNAAFSANPTEGIAPLEVTFNNQSSGDYTTSLWTFGDGVSNGTESPIHTYTEAGIYTVTLTASGVGGTDTFTQTNYITVHEPPPVAAFAATPTRGQSPLTVSFTDQSTGMINSWLWSFGDGITSTQPSPMHVYVDEGIFTVSLTVSGPGGNDNKTQVGYIVVSDQYYIYLPIILDQ